MPSWMRFAAAAAGVVVVAVGAVLAFRAGTDEPDVTPTPAATPEPVLHHLIQLVDADATFGEAQVQASGVLRVRTGRTQTVEAVSLAVAPLDTPQGSSGPISIAQGEGLSRVRHTGSAMTVTVPIRFFYPLLNEVGGQTVTEDVLMPEKEQTGTASFEGRITGREWRGTLTITPDAIEGTDLSLPEGEITVAAPAVYETQSQFDEAGGGLPVSCIGLQREGQTFSEEDIAAAVTEMRTIWREHGRAILTVTELEQVNSELSGTVPTGRIRHPNTIPGTKCYTIRFEASHDTGGGASVDISRRTITVGQNILTTCEDTSLGRILAHLFGHPALMAFQDEESRGADNLMRRCAPGTALDDEQLAEQWSFVAEVAPRLTVEGAGVQQNVTYNALLGVLENVEAPSLSPSPEGSPSPSPTTTPRRTPRPTRRPTARPATPTPPPATPTLPPGTPTLPPGTPTPPPTEPPPTEPPPTEPPTNGP